ncbi:glucosaminidase domain-containing protein [Flavobacterium frigoris]|uniref:Peptidoglycan hydrolase n=1 Tax=Flavobacterium frigoris (strain PS1) TaxID=1086011 RepID=H7FR58_FLAFP|nr:glucosaminidase domain-containing protein [Flavobacterium frigoris]EIA08841.1 hemagglutinin [Flavobacterium frigoris PS1]
MFKKILLILTAILIVSCNATKPVIVTTKSAPVVTKKVPSRSNKRTNVAKPIVKKIAIAAQDKEEDEVIESTSRTVVSNDIVANYIAQYKDIAMSNMKIYGIPASIILAQGILESGAGKGDLAIRANNHFGIKCHDWTGESVRHDDDARQECFRKYGEPAESFKDHALFLTGRGRYSRLFSLPKEDYEAWAKGLRSAGYATDPRYPQKLISYIQRYDLGRFDSQVLGTNYTPMENQVQSVRIVSVESYNGDVYVVQKGDTLYSISRKFNLVVDQLKQKNKLSANTLSIGQKLIVN